jgi:hypothetical protein
MREEKLTIFQTIKHSSGKLGAALKILPGIDDPPVNSTDCFRYYLHFILMYFQIFGPINGVEVGKELNRCTLCPRTRVDGSRQSLLVSRTAR